MIDIDDEELRKENNRKIRALANYILRYQEDSHSKPPGQTLHTIFKTIADIGILYSEHEKFRLDFDEGLATMKEICDSIDDNGMQRQEGSDE